uniref:AMP-binding enzyme C-terminal domain-containing protein n=1 Tax=Salix viminalis TaxID=40686 RepID=A0A6N2KXZ8_SALVM
MPHFMVPKTVVFKDDQLPRTSTGKIQKFVLKEIAKVCQSLSFEEDGGFIREATVNAWCKCSHQGLYVSMASEKVSMASEKVTV